MIYFERGDTVCDIYNYLNPGETKGIVINFTFDNRLSRIQVRINNEKWILHTYAKFYENYRIVLTEKIKFNGA